MLLNNINHNNYNYKNNNNSKTHKYNNKMWLVIVTIFIPINLSNGFHIQITKSDHLIYNNQKINATNLHDYLEKHEKLLLFGNHNLIPDYQLINVIHRTRRKRSSTEGKIEFNVGDEDLELSLIKSNNLIDDSFVFIKRYENSSQVQENSHKLVDKYLHCFYRDEFLSAFDLCDESIRGLILRNHTADLTIKPLPQRFGKGAHLLLQQFRDRNNFFNEKTMFEPNMTDYIITASKPNDKQSQQQPVHRRSTEVRHSERPLAAHFHNQPSLSLRVKRQTMSTTMAQQNKSSNKFIPDVLHVETAIFVDKDLFRHMSKNFPKETESQMIRFVLAMVNGVQLLYNHPSLGKKINFVLKRLEILHNDPVDLQRSSDIDIYLNSFCQWQRKLNPVSDSDILHFDHAVILTGLDLYVVSKSGKVSSQVVGLAPVAGMCTMTSSCTINEGKHFESVFVVAHEIGHNLGMRHDTSDNSCDPSLYIMSPTLGSGKITWSQCSRNYLNTFLKTTQATCLFDRGHFGTSLDHSAEGLLPGERFDADQQCMLKYGKDSIRSKLQNISEICRDLHCQRNRYTWTSHPALEGTTCGEMMWCKSGSCTLKAQFLESYSMPKQIVAMHYTEPHKEESNKISSMSLTGDINLNAISYWSNWGAASDCESGCLYGESGRLKEGSTGLKIYTRTCLDNRSNRKKCQGTDRKYSSCTAKQCYNLQRTTIQEFANQICNRAKEYDTDLTGVGIQRVGTAPEESCKVFCETRTDAMKTKSWLFPDGTTCKNQNSDFDDSFYCINGRCEKFTCENTTTNMFKLDSAFCPQNLIFDDKSSANSVLQDYGRDYKSMNLESIDRRQDPFITSSTAAVANMLVAAPSTSTTQFPVANNIPTENSRPNYYVPNVVSFSKSDAYNSWRNRNFNYDKPNSDNFNINQDRNVNNKNRWQVKSGCHFSCMELSKGMQLVTSKVDQSTNIQLCTPETIACDRLKTTYEYSTSLCSKYRQKVRGLSGIGMQISPTIDDPDRGCKVACQDDYISHRFYLVNGQQGYFPFGTKCSKDFEKRYCVNGKCLLFGNDNTPVNKSYNTISSIRTRRSLGDRQKRNFIYYAPVNVTETLTRGYMQTLLSNMDFEVASENNKSFASEHIDFFNPIYITMEEYY